MAKADVEFILSKVRTRSYGKGDTPHGGPLNPQGHESSQAGELLESEVEEQAERLGLIADSDFKVRTVPPMPIYRDAFSAQAFTEILTWLTTYQVPLAYTGGAAVGAAAFVRNCLGSITEWKQLQAGRSFTINVRGKPLRIESGSDVEDVVAAIEKKLKE